MQARKRLEKTSLSCSLLWATGRGGGNYGKTKLVLFFPPQLEEGPADKCITSNLVSQHTF